MTKAITVRLDEADYAALHQQSERLKVRPGTLARMLVHAGLNEGDAVAERPISNLRALAALDRMVERSRKFAPTDVVKLVNEGRAELGFEQ